MKYILALTVVLMLAGCKEPRNLNIITYEGLECGCVGDVKLISGSYQNYCLCAAKINYVKAPIKNKTKKIRKWKYKKVSNNKVAGCETTIAEIFNSKQFEKPIVICKGKLLTGNQKTKTVYVNK